MAFPAEEHRIFVTGDVLEPDEVNDIEAAIVRMAGLGQVDAPLQVNAGLIVPDGQVIELGDAPWSSLRHDEEESRVLPYSLCTYGPLDDSDIFIDDDGWIDVVSGTLTLHIPIGLVVPRGVRLQFVNFRHRRHTANTWTVELKSRDSSGVVTVIDTEVSSTANTDETELILNAGDLEIVQDTQYYLVAVGTGTGLRYISSRPRWTNPPP